MNTPDRIRQRGLSLIELMVAMTLGLLVAGAMVLLFANSKETYILNENLARLQENGRFAMHLISRDLRWADYRGCPVIPAEAERSGFESIFWQSRLPDAITGENNSGLNNSDTVTIVFQPNACNSDDLGATQTWVYNIAQGAAGRPSLFRSENGGNPVELVEDVANLQILYGEDTNNDDIPNYYVDFGSITDRARIVSVRLTLTAQAPGVLQSANGDRLTRDFASTVVLRNRLP